MTTWKIDTAHTQVNFSAKHMMVTNVRGTFHDVDGTIELDENDPTRSRGAFRVGTASVDTNFVARDTHLRSPDFFDAERFPELGFASKTIERKGDEVTIDGELTLRGVTKSVTITGTVVGPTPDAGVSGPIQRLALDIETTIDRREFGIEWNRDLPSGDPALSNDVKITANLALVQA